jgi:hypothetical protein
MEDYRKALETKEFVNHSAEALRECQQFRYDANGNVVLDKEDCGEESGARASHGDYVIADALAWKIGKEMGVRARPAPAKPPVFNVFSLETRRLMAAHPERYRHIGGDPHATPSRWDWW